MPDEAASGATPRPLDGMTALALERTYLAHERTHMAWVRTALALISFGFTIAKLLLYLQEQQRDRAPRLSPHWVGVSMIGIGVLSLAVATWHHGRAVRALRDRDARLPRSLAGTLALVIAALGLFALAVAVVR